MDPGEGWVPLTMGPSKFLFPKTNVNLLIRGTRTKGKDRVEKYEGKAGGGPDGGRRWLKVVPDDP